jgi:hypothetical protein
MIEFGVIVKVPRLPNPGEAATDVAEFGNLAAAIVYGLDRMTTFMVMQRGRIPVFTLGEIMIMDSETGREISGAGRKPSKWDVECRTFDKLEDAIACSKEVSEGALL